MLAMRAGFVFYQQQNLGLRFGTAKMHLPPPPLLNSGLGYVRS